MSPTATMSVVEADLAMIYTAAQQLNYCTVISSNSGVRQSIFSKLLSVGMKMGG